MKSVWWSGPPKLTFAVHSSGTSIWSTFVPLASKTETPLPVRYRCPSLSSVIPSEPIAQRTRLFARLPPGWMSNA